ncbi:tetratricopeptide repeat protein [Polaribacter sp.]|uniref:tetratricopeptide repeat protein n=1 Tax=Polaribacter sp. TaxID=1920175 RepID=UPI003F6D168C
MKKLIFLFLVTLSGFVNAQQNKAQNDYLLAENYYREGAYEKATQIYKKLYDSSPFNTTYLGRLISCYQETEQFSKAETLLKNRIKANKSQIYLYVYLGSNFEKQGAKVKASENYNLAIKGLEKTPSYGGLIGRLFKDYNQLDNAILAYQKAMEANKNANYSFQIAQIYGEKGEFKQMFEAYIDMVDKNEQYFSLVQRYTSKYITDDSENESNILFRKTLLRKSLSKPKDVWNILLSWLFTQQKDYTKALLQEKALYQRKPSSLTSIFTLGKIAFENQAYNASKECFTYIVEKSTTKSEVINANLYLAKIAVVTNNPETEVFFKSLFETFGKNTLTIKLQVEYADYLTFSKNEPTQANAVLEEALTYANSKFDKARIKLKLGDVLVFTSKFNKALIYFSQIQTQLKNHQLGQEARFKVAQTSYFKGDFDWAKAQLKVLKGSTTQLIANDAVNLFLKISDNEPVDSIPSGLKQLARAELLAFQNKDDAALAELNSLITSKDILINGLIPGEVIYDDVYFFRAKLLIKQKKYEDAILDLAKIVDADNQGFLTDDVYFMMAEIYKNHLNDTEKAKEYYQKIIFEQPSSIFLVDARKNFRKLRGDNL